MSRDAARILFEIEGGDHWSEEEFRSELASAEARLFLWPSEAAPEGFVLCRLQPSPDSEGLEAWVMNLAVRSRGHGQGRLLWAAFEGWARALDARVERFGLEVASRNVAARRLYEGAGFGLVGTRKNYYKNSDDALIYLKRIRQE